jgi:hypothetical protein
MNCICKVLGTQGEPGMSAVCDSVALRTSFKKKQKKQLNIFVQSISIVKFLKSIKLKAL